MNSTRRTALITGLLFVGTFVTSIIGLLLYAPVLDHPDYVLGAGSDTRISMGAFLELLLVVTNVGTAVTLFPILKRQSESLALSYVTSRVIESTIIAIGVISLLSVVTLQQNLHTATGADAAALVTTGRALVAVHDWTFLLGPLFCAGFGNGILLGYLMYRSKLVPQRLALLGVVGGPLACVAGTCVLFGVFDQTSPVSFLLTIPEILWEASLGLWLIIKGFSDAPIAAATQKDLDASAPSPRPAIVGRLAPQLP